MSQEAELPLQWSVTLYGSGTIIVAPVTSRRLPHYYVCHPAADNEGQHLRYEIAKELERWLNGEDEPWWLEFMHREGAEAARTPHGSLLQAVGPMIDTAKPPLFGDWETDMSGEAVFMRRVLIAALLHRKLPKL